MWMHLHMHCATASSVSPALELTLALASAPAPAPAPYLHLYLQYICSTAFACLWTYAVSSCFFSVPELSQEPPVRCWEAQYVRQPSLLQHARRPGDHWAQEESEFCSMYCIQHCFICRPSEFPQCWRMQGSNPGLLRLRHWQSVALTT